MFQKLIMCFLVFLTVVVFAYVGVTGSVASQEVRHPPEEYNLQGADQDGFTDGEYSVADDNLLGHMLCIGGLCVSVSLPPHFVPILAATTLILAGGVFLILGSRRR